MAIAATTPVARPNHALNLEGNVPKNTCEENCEMLISAMTFPELQCYAIYRRG